MEPRAIKVIEVPFGYHPEPVGGTEVYVAALTRHLRELGVEVLIAAPGTKHMRYEHDSVPVERFEVSEPTDLRGVYGEGDEVAAQRFGEILDRERPDVVHLHALSRGVSLKLVRESHRRGAKVVFTYHTPTVTCQRGSMMRWGKTPCDGLMEVHACSRCNLHGVGLNRALAGVLGSMPLTAGRIMARCGRRGGIWTALRMTELVAYRHEQVCLLLNEVDHIVAVCNWVRDVLLRNGANAAKLTLSRQGLAEVRPRTPHRGLLEAAVTHEEPGGRVGETPLRVAYLGRLDPVKGVETLIRAFRSAPQLNARLDIYGVVQAGNESHFADLKRLAAGDTRIAFLAAVPSHEVTRVLRNYDMLAVPSEWLESGPLVVLEAFGAGIPVIGSRLGGIAELVEDGVNGLLVAPGDVEAWAGALARLCGKPTLVIELRRRILAPRTMATVAEEMRSLYAETMRMANLPAS